MYLDNASTTKPYAEAVLEAVKYMTDIYGNPESPHDIGYEAKKCVDDARSQISRYIGCDEEQLIFTSSGSESNTLVVMGIAEYLKRKGKTHIITTAVEHKSIINSMKKLESEGFEVTYLPPEISSRGFVEKFRRAIRPETGFASVMCVNNETGQIFPIEAIADVCFEHGISLHSDCVQGVDLMPCPKVGIDFYSISAHKIGGIKGAACVYARDKSMLSPIINGGEQEYGLRGGTLNVPAIAAFAKAYQIYAKQSIGYVDNSRIIPIITETLEHYSVKYNINPASRSGAHIVSITFPNVEADTLISLLNEKEIYVSSGSACNSNSMSPSATLKAYGYSDKEARETIRISLTTLEEHSREQFIEDMRTIAVLAKALQVGLDY